MPITFIQANGGGNGPTGNTLSSGSFTITLGNALVAVATVKSGAGLPAVTGMTGGAASGQTWQRLVQYRPPTFGGTLVQELWYLAKASGTTAITAAYGAAGAFDAQSAGLGVMEFSGITGIRVSGVTADGSSTSPLAPAITPQVGDLVVDFLCCSNTLSNPPASPWVNNNAIATFGTAFITPFSYLIATSSTAVQAAWTQASSAAWAGIAAAFQTAASPTATTSAASGVTDTQAVLQGTVNPNGQSTSVYFKYGLNTSYGTNTSTQAAGSGSADEALTATVLGLTPSSTYHYQVVASSLGGTTQGGDQTFTTQATVSGVTGITQASGFTGLLSLPQSMPTTLLPAAAPFVATPPAPSVATTGAQSLTQTTATLTGTANPSGNDTHVYFQWGPTLAYGQLTPEQDIGGGSANANVQANLTSLTPGVTYHYRTVAYNANATVYGQDAPFATVSPPSGIGPGAGVSNATLVTTGSGTINGWVNPNGYSTNVYFQWGQTTAYGFTTTSQPLGSGTSPVTISADISGLAAGTSYHYRVVASNAFGTTYTTDMALVTSGTGPGPGPPSPPVTAGAFAQRVIDSFQPWMTPFLAWYVAGIGAMFEEVAHEVYDVGIDGQPGFIPGYGRLLDVTLCDDDDLAYLGQYVGSVITPGTDPVAARSEIVHECALQRGTLRAITFAAKRNLAGSQYIAVQERLGADGVTADAYWLQMEVLASEVADMAALVAAVDNVLPGGVFITITAVSYPTWQSASKQWQAVAAHVTWNNVAIGDV